MKSFDFLFQRRFPLIPHFFLQLPRDFGSVVSDRWNVYRRRLLLQPRRTSDQTGMGKFDRLHSFRHSYPWSPLWNATRHSPAVQKWQRTRYRQPNEDGATELVRSFGNLDFGSFGSRLRFEREGELSLVSSFLLSCVQNRWLTSNLDS